MTFHQRRCIIFLSTLSLRRATARRVLGFVDPDISIHALLAESDLSALAPEENPTQFLSTLSLRRATVKLFRQNYECFISIHALLAESDAHTARKTSIAGHFYPRSPCGERLRHAINFHTKAGISIHALLAESDPQQWHLAQHPQKFLSTLSLRRATKTYRRTTIPNLHFYPRSPCGERLVREPATRGHNKFLSTLSLRRATSLNLPSKPIDKFLSTLSLRRATAL